VPRLKARTLGRPRQPSGGPGARGRDERFLRKAFVAQVSKLSLSVWIEASGVDPSRPYAERERFPPLLECRVLDAHRQDSGLDLLQASCFEQLLQVPLASARKIGFVRNVGVERARRLPKCAERPLPAGMIPDTGRDNAPRACHARHLGQPGDSVSHEVNDELRQDRVEGPLRKGQVLSRRSYNVDAGKAFSSRANELFRRINGGHGGRAESPDQLSGECAGAAADVQGELIGRHLSKGRQLGASGTE
jgi:hypothetical protein